eukprot:2298583-Rhodomonas_salina.4
MLPMLHSENLRQDALMAAAAAQAGPGLEWLRRRLSWVANKRTVADRDVMGVRRYDSLNSDNCAMAANRVTLLDG